MTVVCHPGLASVFAEIPWVAMVAQREVAPGTLHDSWLPGMSAALALGLGYEDLSGKPYLRANTALEKKWSERLAAMNSGERRLKVGIRWSGNPQFEHQQLRLFPPQLIWDLKDFSGLQLFSLQRDDPRPMPDAIVDLSAELETWQDTAAIIANMDLVISSCTSVAHLSAAMGKPTWIVVPALPYFPWARPGNRSPWYDSVRLFRQSRYGDWTNVREELHSELQKYVLAF